MPRPGDIVEFVFGGEDETDDTQCVVIPSLDDGLAGYDRVEDDKDDAGRGVIAQLDGADSSSDDDSDVDDDSSEDDIGGTDEVSITNNIVIDCKNTCRSIFRIAFPVLIFTGYIQYATNTMFMFMVVFMG